MSHPNNDNLSVPCLAYRLRAIEYGFISFCRDIIAYRNIFSPPMYNSYSNVVSDITRVIELLDASEITYDGLDRVIWSCNNISINFINPNKTEMRHERIHCMTTWDMFIEELTKLIQDSEPNYPFYSSSSDDSLSTISEDSNESSI